MFEKVNVSSLNAAISTCKSNLQTGNINNIINSISSGSVWQSGAKNVLVEALENLVNNKYQNLLRELDRCSNMSNLISDYKNLENENIRYNSNINYLRGRLYYTKETIDSEGNKIYKTVKDSYVDNQIRDLTNKVNYNKERMNGIKNNVINIAG